MADTNEIPLYARATFDAYAFIGWLTTCIDHQDIEIPTEPDPLAGQWLADLGDVGFGWRFDVACRRGWLLVGETNGGKTYAERFILPRCGDFIRGCVLGKIRSR